MSENEDIQKIYYERFNLYKLIKNEVNVDRELYNKLKDKYKEVEEIIIDTNEKSNLLNRYFIESLNDEISKIYSIYQNYLNNNNKVNLWINKEKQIYMKEFNEKFMEKTNLIKIVKDIKLFEIIYEKFSIIKDIETNNKELKIDEETKFNNAKKIFDECKIIFTDIYKGNREILDGWQKEFKKDQKATEDELNKLKKYYDVQINQNTDIIKNIRIFTKKNIIKDDIKYILYFIRLFKAEETE